MGSTLVKVALVVAFALIVGVPFALRPEEASAPEGALRLVIITPHNEQIRSEFGRAFSEWHFERFGEPAVVDWRTPGGTSEIRRQLTAEYVAALANGPIPAESMSYDLLFGGGSYEHMQIARPVAGEATDPVTVTVPAGTTVMAPEGGFLRPTDTHDWELPGGARLTFPDATTATLPPGATLTTDGSTLGDPSADGMRVLNDLTIDFPAGTTFAHSISTPVDFTQVQLDGWYGPNEIGRKPLYDPAKHWFGTALSAFGIIYNRDVLRELRVREPTSWADLANPKLQGWVALADPGASGSINTTFEVILNLRGWEEGWRILREAAANSRYFADSSSKVPIDVSLGEAAVGMCIDFYGRYQAQAIAEAGDEDRMGYVDPRDTDIDPDPISLLTGARQPELARRFIEFVLSEEGQALWQYPARGDNDAAPGPVAFELRRMPIRRVMYEPRHFSNFVDRVNPFEIAQPMDEWDNNIRTFIPPLFHAMAISSHDDLQAAWAALNAAGPTHPRYDQMRRLFHAMPEVRLDDGTVVSLATTASLPALRDRWRQDATGRRRELDRIAWTEFFRDNYRKILEMSEID